jgi:hypothetical protein
MTDPGRKRMVVRGPELTFLAAEDLTCVYVCYGRDDTDEFHAYVHAYMDIQTYACEGAHIYN